ncbi:MAG: hypothetical protein JSR67_13165 [Proteobacteria bacterium]|nr:hypothetical protein [Pseudomonadota bacterium]
MRARSTQRLLPMAALALMAFGLPAGASDFNEAGNIVIADQYNNRVVEVDPRTHRIVWSFGDGSDQPGPHSIVGVNDAERFGSFTLLSGTGIPPSNPALPGCSTPATGCADNRVMIVNRRGRIVWQYGEAGVGGFGANQINTPVHALMVWHFPGHYGFHVLITDQANSRVILVNRSHQVVWQYGMTQVPGLGPDLLNNPNSAELLDNGHILIADENNNRAIEVTAGKQLVQAFSAGGTASGVAFASRLANGNTLLTDSNNNRIIELSPADAIVWEYDTNTDPGSNTAPLPTRAVRLANGNTLISDQYNNRVIEVTRGKQIVFQQGMLNVLGKGFNQLNGPYDAKVVGDFTGLTPPFGRGHDR